MTQARDVADPEYPTILRTLDNLSRRTETGSDEGRVVWRSWGCCGPVVLLLHGGAGSWQHWSLNIATLALRYRIIAPDLPGMGESDRPAEPETPDGVARMLANGLDQMLKADVDFDLVGFSFGGFIGSHLAKLLPRKVRSLTLVGTGGWSTLPTNAVELVRVRGLSAAEQWEAHRTNLERFMLAEKSRVDDLAIAIQARNSERLRLDSRKFYKLGPLTEVLPKLTTPLNGIWGELDAAARGHLNTREDLLRSMNSALEFRVIKGAGHWVPYEQPEEFNAVLLDLLERSYPS